MTVDSKAFTLKEIFGKKYSIGYYQREYVWQRKQIEDLISDLSSEFLKNWSDGDQVSKVSTYHPYFMGEIILSVRSNELNDVIDGQQRITTLTLLLIYLYHRFGDYEQFPKSEVARLIYSDYYGQKRFNLDIEERRACIHALFEQGEYKPGTTDTLSVHTIVDRYADIDECWNPKISELNITHFTYWLMEKVVFSKVWTDSDEFAYVIFETMNDRGLSLTQVEMLRSYLLTKVGEENRKNAIRLFDGVVKRLMNIKLNSKSKAEFEFFKIYFRSHYTEGSSQAHDPNSDFVQIGKAFHRWIRDNEKKLGLTSPNDLMEFLYRIEYFSNVYEKINSILLRRDTRQYLYLVVNGDYGFTLQPALILAAINYKDSDDEVARKIQIVTKHLTKILSWRVWNQSLISHNYMEDYIYELCKNIRGKNSDELKGCLEKTNYGCSSLGLGPVLNLPNRHRIMVLLSLITEIVARESNESSYILNESNVEIEHIWSNHFKEHMDEFSSEQEFSTVRNTIGDLLVLPKSFNASYGDKSYSCKVQQYFSQNILAQSLCGRKYENNPGFLQFVGRSGLKFRPYDEFKKQSIVERTELYRSILEWNWKVH